MAYAIKAKHELEQRGLKGRVKLMSCTVKGELHVVAVVDGTDVYSVGMKTIKKIDRLNWKNWRELP